MGDLMDLIVMLGGAIVVFIGAVVGGFVAVLLVQGYGYANLNNKLVRIENKLASGLGVQAREEQSQEMQEVMLQAAQIMKDESITKEDKPKALINLGLQHPKVAMQLLGKVGLKGLF